MILTAHDPVDIDSDEAPESVDFSVDQDSLNVMMRGFSDNLYSNKVGSVCREIASNSKDAMTEAGCNEPTTVTLIKPDALTSGSITFTDVGVGLSPERVKTIYSKYFASTKRNDNTQIGGFGLV